LSIPAASVMSSFARMNFRAAPQMQQPQNDVTSFFDDICSAIHQAWTQWAIQASLGDVVINAAIGTGGRVMGPEWGPLLQSRLTPTSSFGPHWRAVAGVLSSQWNLYQNSISVPGLPLWPTFAMVAAPQAPPTPSTPIPLQVLAQDKGALSRALLREQFLGELTRQTPDDRPLFEVLAGAIETGFTMWQTSTVVKNVIGAGPVPSFAPPQVMAGPVVSGISLRVPGTFA
jgi:hypothetical protein